MAMAGVDSGSLYRRTHSLSRLAWSWVGGRLAPVLHSSNEPRELSQWLCHDDSAINIVLELLGLLLLLSLLLLQEAQLSQRDCATLHVIEYFAKSFKLKTGLVVVQGH